jgi:hypothetical protein
MYKTSDTIAIAKTQIGYHEGKSGSHWNNLQKYAKPLGFTNGLAWCDTFVQVLFWLAGVSVPTGSKSAGCEVSCAAYKRAGRFTEYPVVGAIVFFGPHGGTHCGIVTSYDDVHVHTIEGNTNTTGSSEGDGVYAKTHVRRDDYVYGYGVPYYHGKANSPDPHWHGREMSKK